MGQEQADSTSDYDAIIVGGRPAGATLAARLGMLGWNVLLLERATVPSPGPVSFPVVFAGTLALLDEIGADEESYARGTPMIRRWVNEFREDFRTFNHVPDLHGRDYAYAIDRARFDAALWRNAARFPTVTARQNFVVTDLLRDGERVTGLRGRNNEGCEETFTAGCVIGADGRWSLVARKAGARTVEAYADLPTSVYYAYWDNAQPYDGGGPAVHIYVPRHGFGLLLLDSADGRLGVGMYGQSALLDEHRGKLDAFYEQSLRAQPRVWRRLAGARRVSEVRGMRRIGRQYRSAGGSGWVLVGDALYNTDPMDGQGLFDAVLGAKLLSQGLDDWRQGRATWDEMLAAYAAAVRAETLGHYRTTRARIKWEIYTRHPHWAFKTWLRWLHDDPDFKRQLALLMTRGIDAERWLPPSLLGQAIIRGAMGDVRRLITRAPRPNRLPPLPNTGMQPRYVGPPGVYP